MLTGTTVVGFEPPRSWLYGHTIQTVCCVSSQHCAWSLLSDSFTSSLTRHFITNPALTWMPLVNFSVLWTISWEKLLWLVMEHHKVRFSRELTKHVAWQQLKNRKCWWSGMTLLLALSECQNQNNFHSNAFWLKGWWVSSVMMWGGVWRSGIACQKKLLCVCVGFLFC